MLSSDKCVVENEQVPLGLGMIASRVFNERYLLLKFWKHGRKRGCGVHCNLQGLDVSVPKYPVKERMSYIGVGQPEVQTRLGPQHLRGGDHRAERCTNRAHPTLLPFRVLEQGELQLEPNEGHFVDESFATRGIDIPRVCERFQ